MPSSRALSPSAATSPPVELSEEFGHESVELEVGSGTRRGQRAIEPLDDAPEPRIAEERGVRQSITLENAVEIGAARPQLNDHAPRTRAPELDVVGCRRRNAHGAATDLLRSPAMALDKPALGDAADVRKRVFVPF